MMLRRMAVAAAMSITILAGTASCASETDNSVQVTETEANVIDVRTPEEYEEGHVEGSINVDLSSPAFFDELEKLDPDQAYVVYCRSGNRSAEAVKIMKEQGFTDVEDGGGLDDMEDAGYRVG